MLCEYRSTLEDYKAAQRLHIRCNKRVRFWFLFWCRFMPVVGVVALVLLLWDAFVRGLQFPAWLGAVLAMLSFLGIYVPAIRPFAIRRSFRKFREGIGDQNEPLQLELRAGELITRAPGRSESRFQPAAIQDMVRDQRICLIYVRKAAFIFVPRSVLPEDFWAALASWSGKSRTC